jgi:hypothetical protein
MISFIKHQMCKTWSFVQFLWLGQENQKIFEQKLEKTWNSNALLTVYLNLKLNGLPLMVYHFRWTCFYHSIYILWFFRKCYWKWYNRVIKIET